VDEVVCYVVGQGAQAQRYYPHYNHLWSAAALTDSSGNVVERFTYDSHGRMTITGPGGVVRNKSAVGWDRGFTGQTVDAETGLMYYRARMYSPTLGRFVGRDPLQYIDGWSQYGGYFVPNDVDPTGYWTMEGVKALFCDTDYSWVICECLSKKLVYSADNLRAEQGDKSFPLNGVNQGDKGISVNSARTDAEAGSTLMHECLHDRTEGEGETPSDKYIDEEAKVRVAEEQWRIKMGLPMKNPRTDDGKNGDFNKIKEKIKESYGNLAKGFETKWDNRTEVKFTPCDCCKPKPKE
jgi:RHS repeat-associated protein